LRGQPHKNQPVDFKIKPATKQHLPQQARCRCCAQDRQGLLTKRKTSQAKSRILYQRGMPRKSMTITVGTHSATGTPRYGTVGKYGVSLLFFLGLLGETARRSHPQIKRETHHAHQAASASGVSVGSITISASPTTKLRANDMVSVSWGGVSANERVGCWIGLYHANAAVRAIRPNTNKTTMYTESDMPWTNPAPVKFIMCSDADPSFSVSGSGKTQLRVLVSRFLEPTINPDHP
jgi:hypothetical protein